MTSAEKTILPFLGAVRRRLWLLETARAATEAFWLVSLGLLVLALAHVTFVSVPPVFIGGAIAASAGWMLLRLISRRPGIEEAAASADRHFGGRELMTTAADCLRRAPGKTSGAAGIVLDQALCAANEWSPRISKTLRQTRRSHVAVALVPLFVAIVLLMASDQPVLKRDAVTTEAPAILSASRDNVSNELAAIRRELIDESTPVSPAGQPAADAEKEKVPVDQENTASAERIETDGESIPGGSRVAGAGASDSAGDADPVTGDVTTARDADLARGESIAITLNGQGAATTMSTGRAYRDAATETPHTPLPALPALAPAQGRISTLTPAQVAYAARYLESGGEDDE